jgi:hypothetical protein
MCTPADTVRCTTMPRSTPVLIFYQTIGWLWALPLTAYALPLCLLVAIEKWVFKKKQANVIAIWSQYAMVIVVYSPWIKAMLMRHPMGNMQAAALGSCILAQDELALQRCWAHERVHVAQAMRWGIVFPLAYIASSLMATSKGGCPYADNRFEREAGL